MDKKSKILLCFLLIFIISSVIITYNKVVIKKDFTIIYSENSTLSQ